MSDKEQSVKEILIEIRREVRKLATAGAKEKKGKSPFTEKGSVIGKGKKKK